MSHVVNGTTITDGALSQIVVAAAELRDGVRVRRRGVAIEDDRVALSIAAPYGGVLPELARAVQERVAAAMTTMCDLDVAVDVTVDEIDE